MKKKLLILLLAVACCLALVGCGQQEESKDYIDLDETAKDVVNGLSEKINGIPVGEYLSKKYPLDSDEIKIYIENGDRFDSIAIDNPEDIRILQKSVQFNLWKYSKADYNGIDKFYVVFNNNTTIALYEEIPYGRLGEGIPDELGNILNSTVYFDIPSDFLLSIKQMIEKYSIK